MHLVIWIIQLTARLLGKKVFTVLFDYWLAVVFCRGEDEGAGDQLGAVARLRGAAGVAAAGGQPRRLLPPGPQRAGDFEVLLIFFSSLFHFHSHGWPRFETLFNWLFVLMILVFFCLLFLKIRILIRLVLNVDDSCTNKFPTCCPFMSSWEVECFFFCLVFHFVQ